MNWFQSVKDNYINLGNVGSFGGNSVANNITMSGNGKANINGVEYDLPPNASISTKNGKVYINGKEVTGENIKNVSEIKIEIHGNVEKADIGNSLTVRGNVYTANAGTSISVYGDIQGNANAGTSIRANNIEGPAMAGTGIQIIK